MTDRVQWNHDLSSVLLRLVDQENPLHRERMPLTFSLHFRFLPKIVSTLQKDIARQAEAIRTIDDPHETLLSGRQPYFANMNLDGAPISPRQVPADDPSRRPSFQGIPPRASVFRPPPAPPSHIALSPRRYGSIGAPTHSPSYARPHAPATGPSAPNAAPPVPHAPHPLSSVTEPGYNLTRRHTSADIRDTPGWPPQPGGPPGPSHGPPFDMPPHPLQQQQNQQHPPPPPPPPPHPQQHPPPASAAAPPSQWPPSPRTRSPVDQGLRDQLNSYQFGAPRRSAVSIARPMSPAPNAPDITPSSLDPPLNAQAAENAGLPAPGGPFGGANGGWSFGGSKLGQRVQDQSAPATRKSSMASNVHSLLNPADTAERDEEGDGGGEDRKRKRMG